MFQKIGIFGNRNSIVFDKILRRLTNNAGGIEGGVSNAEDIVVRVFHKPISTLGKPLKSIDFIRFYLNIYDANHVNRQLEHIYSFMILLLYVCAIKLIFKLFDVSKITTANV
mgnify:CR=1 FL=1